MDWGTIVVSIYKVLAECLKDGSVKSIYVSGLAFARYMYWKVIVILSPAKDKGTVLSKHTFKYKKYIIAVHNK